MGAMPFTIGSSRFGYDACKITGYADVPSALLVTCEAIQVHRLDSGLLRKLPMTSFMKPVNISMFVNCKGRMPLLHFCNDGELENFFKTR